MGEYFHSVRLDAEKCKGCVNCIKTCPTEAIRVRHGKAEIIEERCIDCEVCIRACPNQAKYVHTDPLTMLDNYHYTIALTPPSLYGQFPESIKPAQVLAALINIGFDDVFETAIGAEVVAEATKKLFQARKTGDTLVSSTCPAVIRLIQVRFPELTKLVLPFDSPAEISAQLVKRLKSRELGIPEKEIGVFFITPCAAKMTAIKAPVGTTPSNIDGAFSVHQLYPQLHHYAKKASPDNNYQKASGLGIGWGVSGGEQNAVGIENHLVVDGIHNVISVLEELEMGRLSGMDFIEARACTGGCVGGLLNVQNSFVAKVRLRKLAKEFNKNKLPLVARYPELCLADYRIPRLEVQPRPIVHLDKDIAKAMQKMTAAEKMLLTLPGLDCGACGSPTCKALAEDIALGKARETDCIFILKERIMGLVSGHEKPKKGDGE
ncbi:MAG: [Fe-Fe] hydrogenase large subunit C-terminal domain-containing protein [bacterium]|jgi:iron only hydrogenase large subunit-like protein